MSYTFIAEKSENAGKQKKGGEIKLIILPPRDNSGTFLQIWAYNIHSLIIFNDMFYASVNVNECFQEDIFNICIISY